VLLGEKLQLEEGPEEEEGAWSPPEQGAEGGAQGLEPELGKFGQGNGDREGWGGGLLWVGAEGS